MNSQQAENLRILIRHMETNVKRTLDMGYISDSCGAPACALGEACQIPQFGLTSDGPFSLYWRGEARSMDAPVQEIFGVDAGRLFSGALNGSRHVTPQEWAVEARKVLAENGYSMDDAQTNDGFAAFMDKVREPVAVEA